jgi:predicted nucleic acid-binding protein
MIDRLAVDANAAIDLLRADRPTPPQLRDAREVWLPVSALGELFAGAELSNRTAENLAKVEDLTVRWTVLAPDTETARIYGRLRRSERFSGAARINDLWIAALCIRHDLPLLTSDNGFDAIRELRVIHW